LPAGAVGRPLLLFSLVPRLAVPGYRRAMSELSRRVDEKAAEMGFAGVVRLERSGAVALDAAYGLADRGHGIPMAIGNQLGMASGSKTFTALVVMCLVEQGLLSLATTARQVLGSDLPLIGDDVTVEHLLCHRSGIGDYLDEDELDSEDYPMPVSVHRLARTEDFLPILDGYPTKFPAGERFSYCNGGFVVLALISERVSGRSYQDLVRDLVCSPAGMNETEFLRSDALPGRAALGYVEIEGQWRTNVFHLPVVATGDGGMYTTSADMARFWTALMSGRIVTTETLADMCKPRSEPDPGKSDCYGLGFWLKVDSPENTMSAGDAGVSFWSSHHPERGTTATVISTTMGGARPMAEVMKMSI
jgi:CubicO group peptidase (beta-lactamase class C family)